MKLKQFTEHWERNAFFYEFRARLHKKIRLPFWEGFSRPWCDLDSTQRGILYYLWPPEVALTNWPCERQRSVQDYVNFMIKVDFAQPLEDLLKQVKEKWNELEPELVHLWGIGHKGNPSTTGKVVSASNPELPSRWSLLEALDLESHFGVRLSAAQHTRIKRQTEYYHTGCLEAGIPP